MKEEVFYSRFRAAYDSGNLPPAVSAIASLGRISVSRHRELSLLYRLCVVGPGFRVADPDFFSRIFPIFFREDGVETERWPLVQFLDAIGASEIAFTMSMAVWPSLTPLRRYDCAALLSERIAAFSKSGDLLDLHAMVVVAHTTVSRSGVPMALADMSELISAATSYATTFRPGSSAPLGLLSMARRFLPRLRPVYSFDDFLGGTASDPSELPSDWCEASGFSIHAPAFSAGVDYQMSVFHALVRKAALTPMASRSSVGLPFSPVGYLLHRGLLSSPPPVLGVSVVFVDSPWYSLLDYVYSRPEFAPILPSVASRLISELPSDRERVFDFLDSRLYEQISIPTAGLLDPEKLVPCLVIMSAMVSMLRLLFVPRDYKKGFYYLKSIIDLSIVALDFENLRKGLPGYVSEVANTTTNVDAETKVVLQEGYMDTYFSIAVMIAVTCFPILSVAMSKKCPFPVNTSSVKSVFSFASTMLTIYSTILNFSGVSFGLLGFVEKAFGSRGWIGIDPETAKAYSTGTLIFSALAASLFGAATGGTGIAIGLGLFASETYGADAVRILQTNSGIGVSNQQRFTNTVSLLTANSTPAVGAMIRLLSSFTSTVSQGITRETTGIAFAAIQTTRALMIILGPVIWESFAVGTTYLENDLVPIFTWGSYLENEQSKPGTGPFLAALGSFIRTKGTTLPIFFKFFLSASFFFNKIGIFTPYDSDFVNSSTKEEFEVVIEKKIQGIFIESDIWESAGIGQDGKLKQGISALLTQRYTISNFAKFLANQPGIKVENVFVGELNSARRPNTDERRIDVLVYLKFSTKNRNALTSMVEVFKKYALSDNDKKNPDELRRIITEYKKDEIEIKNLKTTERAPLVINFAKSDLTEFIKKESVPFEEQPNISKLLKREDENRSRAQYNLSHGEVTTKSTSGVKATFVLILAYVVLYWMSGDYNKMKSGIEELLKEKKDAVNALKRRLAGTLPDQRPEMFVNPFSSGLNVTPVSVSQALEAAIDILNSV